MQIDKKTIIVVLIFLAILTLTLLIVQKFNKPIGCLPKYEERIVRGDSMDPMFSEGKEVLIDFNYYICNKPRVGDIVSYRYSASKNPIIKFIKGTEGNSIELKPKDNKWNIVVNGEIIKNSAGQEYLIDKNRYNLLSLYIKDYGNKIPQNALLIMGDRPEGSFDSTSIGLVGTEGLLGKVIEGK